MDDSRVDSIALMNQFPHLVGLVGSINQETRLTSPLPVKNR